MLIKTRGIILRSVKYSETSFILDIYTEAKGLRAYIISGVRSKKAKVSAGLIQLMSLVEMVAYFREDKEMNRIKEIKPAHIYQRLPFEITRSAIGLFMVELAQKSIREVEENQLLFLYLFDAFKYLDTTDQPIANLHLQFMIELSAFLGFAPGENYSPQSPIFDLKEGGFLPQAHSHVHFMDEPNSQLLHQFLRSNLAHCHEIKLNRQVRRQFLDHLLTYYRLHIENFQGMNTLEVLEDIFK